MPDDDDLDTPALIDPNDHANLQHENALLRAGVDLDSEQGKIVRAASVGKTPEEIRTMWELVKPQPPAETLERIEGEEGQAEERRALAASSTVEPEPTDVDPMEQSMVAAREVLVPTRPGQRSGTPVDAVSTAFHLRAEAGGKGDDRVFVK